MQHHHRSAHNSLPLVSVSQMNPLHMTPFYFTRIHCIVILPSCPGLPVSNLFLFISLREQIEVLLLLLLFIIILLISLREQYVIRLLLFISLREQYVIHLLLFISEWEKYEFLLILFISLRKIMKPLYYHISHYVKNVKSFCFYSSHCENKTFVVSENRYRFI
jgi:hypothetical protein